MSATRWPKPGTVQAKEYVPGVIKLIMEEVEILYSKMVIICFICSK